MGDYLYGTETGICIDVTADSTFKGHFKNGLQDGIGTLAAHDGSFNYTGQWKND
jgi:hypothetical protein